MIDTRLSYMPTKRLQRPRSLARILLNTRGPKQERWKLIASVVTSQVLYAAPVWAKAATTSSYMSGLTMCHQDILCLPKISEEAALVIAFLVPVQELVRETVEVEKKEHGRPI